MNEALRSKRIVRLRADMTEKNPEASQLLHELGNAAESIPFVAVYSWKAPDQPVTLADLFTTDTLLGVLEQVEPSRSAGESVAARPGSDEQAGAAQPPQQKAATKEAKESESIWRPFSISEVRQLRERGVPLVIDWTADW